MHPAVADGAIEAIALLRRRGRRPARSTCSCSTSTCPRSTATAWPAGAGRPALGSHADGHADQLGAARRGEKTQQAGNRRLSDQAGPLARLRGALRALALTAAPAPRRRPRARTARSHRSRAPVRHRSRSGARRRRSRMVLVVEDNIVNQRVFTAMLASSGLPRRTSPPTGRRPGGPGPQRLRAVLMDCQMPVMDGYQATAKLRSVKALTAHTRSSP